MHKIQVLRFRLRFLLQEFELLQGETLLGRGPDCHITIEDPLISRHHGKIVVSGSLAMYHDLGSRNGTRINGRLISTPAPLTNTDRIRLGAQELVFVQVNPVSKQLSRSTGRMQLCQRCNTPFPEGPEVCPHCGGLAIAPLPAGEDDTTPGIGIPSRRGWILQMLGEVLERALSTNKLGEADRLLRRAAEETEERVGSGDIDPKQLGQISEYALQLAVARNEPRWVLWVIDMHRRAAKLPSEGSADRLVEALRVDGVAQTVFEFAESSVKQAASASEVDAQQLARLVLLADAARTAAQR